MNLTTTDSEQEIKILFDNHFHQLVLHAYKHINDYSQSEEIVQDIFVKVWQSFEQIKDIKDLKAYLYKAVRNSSLNYLRHLKIRQEFLFEATYASDNTENSIEESITDADTFNRIHHALNKLPDHWKEAIILSKYDKLKYHEIAERMNISQKTVEKYISKVLQFLRGELKDLLITAIIFFKMI